MATKLAKFEGELVDPHDLPVEPSSIVSTHWAIFGWSLLVVVLAGTFQLGDGPSQVMIPFLNQPLPPLCALQRFFGIHCPGCGLTRSFISLAHGQWSDGWRYNPAGPFWFALVVIQIPYRLYQIARLRQGHKEFQAGAFSNGLLWLALAILLLQWLVQQILIGPI